MSVPMTYRGPANQREEKEELTPSSRQTEEPGGMDAVCSLALRAECSG